MPKENLSIEQAFDNKVSHFSNKKPNSLNLLSVGNDEMERPFQIT